MTSKGIWFVVALNYNITMLEVSLDEQECDVTDTLLDSWVPYHVWVINWYPYAQIRQKLYCMTFSGIWLCCSAENCNTTMFGESFDEQKFDVTDVIRLLSSYALISYNYSVTNDL